MHGGPPQQQYCRCSRENRRIHVDGFMIHLIWAKEAHYIYFFLFPLLHSFHACGILRSQSHVFSIIWNCGHVFLFFFFPPYVVALLGFVTFARHPVKLLFKWWHVLVLCLSMSCIKTKIRPDLLHLSSGTIPLFLWITNSDVMTSLKKKTAWNLRSPMLGVHTKDNTIWPKKKK